MRTEFGRFTRQVSGYSLEHLLPEHGRSVDRFLVGSEGTLGVVLEATVRLVEDEPDRLLVVLGYPSMVEAADAVPGAARGGRRPMIACEGLDARIVDLVRPGSAVPELPRGAGWLFVEVVGEAPRRCVAGGRGGAARSGHRLVADAAEAAALWRIREDGAGLAARSLTTPGVLRLGGRRRPARAARRLAARLRRAAARARPRRRALRPLRRRLRARADRLPVRAGPDGGAGRSATSSPPCALKLRDHGGSLSGEHGDGRARSELLPLMYDAESLRLFAAVKAICDPDNLLNPGNLVDPAPLDADLRPARPRLPVTPLLRLPHDGGSSATPCTAAPASASAWRRRPAA